MSCYQLIKIMTKFEKRTKKNEMNEKWTIFKLVMSAEKPSSVLNKVQRNSARKMTSTVQLQAWHVQLSY